MAVTMYISTMYFSDMINKWISEKAIQNEEDKILGKPAENKSKTKLPRKIARARKKEFLKCYYAEQAKFIYK